jgi:4-carboxymuconolactone decarboxylase
LFKALLIAAAAASIALPTMAQERLSPIKPEAYDAAQKKAAAEFEAARKAPVFGPFGMLIRSPEVMTAARSMGDYLRYGSTIGTTLSEFVILITAREWSQDYEWSLHMPIALRQGIRQSHVDAIAQGRRPEGMSEDEAICYDFSTELHRNKSVSDATYARAVKRWGEKGVVDLAAINGYYSFLAMTMNVARTDPVGPRLPRMP